MQMVILAGGLATRLRPLTEKVPKSMVPVEGKPFLEYQIELLKRHGITDVVLCIGHLGAMIRECFGDGKRFGVSIHYSEDGTPLLGTAGAVKKAEPLLEETFFIMYGDSYLMLDYGKVWRFFEGKTKLGLMVVYRNYNRGDRSNVIIGDGLVKVYNKRERWPQMIHIDQGLSILRRQALAGLRPGKAASLEELYQGLIARGELLAFEVGQRFYEIGSPEGLAEFGQLAGAQGVTA